MKLEQIQGNVIGFNKPNQTFLFLRFDAERQEEVQRWLGAVVRDVTTADYVLEARKDFRRIREQARRDGIDPPRRFNDEIWRNLAFTYAGLKALGTAPLDGFPPEFVAGMAARADELGDVGTSAPGEWKIAGPRAGESQPVHALMILACDEAERLAELVGQLEKDYPLMGVDILHIVKGREIEGEPGTEHFGFKDDISQPAIRNDAVNPRDALQRGQVRISPGEFVLGYPRQDPMAAADDEATEGSMAVASPDWTMDGSYLVFRRLKQDVQGFKDFVKAKADEHNIHEDLFKAKLVGRYPSGAPLAELKDPAGGMNRVGGPVSQTVPKNDPLLGKDHINNFDYAGDGEGELVPRGAHIRRLHPRDLTGTGPSFAHTRRILRRGIPYIDEKDPQNDRGLLFLCYQRSIADQYEFLQQSWANDPYFPAPGKNTIRSGRDPLIGSGRAEGVDPQFNVPGINGDHIALMKWVTMTGGDYFFSPSKEALARLADPEGLNEAERWQLDIERRQARARALQEEVDEARRVKAAERWRQAAVRRREDFVPRLPDAEALLADARDRQGEAEDRLRKLRSELAAAERSLTNAIEDQRRLADAQDAERLLAEAGRIQGMAEGIRHRPDRVADILAANGRAAAAAGEAAEPEQVAARMLAEAEDKQSLALSLYQPVPPAPSTITGAGDCKLQVTVAFDGLDERFYYPWRVWVGGEPVGASQRGEYLVPNSAGFATGTMWLRLQRLLEALNPELTAGRIVQSRWQNRPASEVLGAYPRWEVELIARADTGDGKIAAIPRLDPASRMITPLHKIGSARDQLDWTTERVGEFFPIDMHIGPP